MSEFAARIEREPVAKSELERLCGEAGIPGDFYVTQVTWQPGYDAFYYRELLKRARTMYLFRDEYSFELALAIAVETPQSGHATYLFARRQSIDGFLAVYTSVTRADIRQNRGNAAERLGFMGRVVHGANSTSWLKELRVRLGETS